ncbi:MAG: hypothetical protein ACKVQA_07030 [Burkholderiales bacterium]
MSEKNKPMPEQVFAAALAQGRAEQAQEVERMASQLENLQDLFTALGKDYDEANDQLAKFMTSFNRERKRAEAAEAEVTRLKVMLDDDGFATYVAAEVHGLREEVTRLSSLLAQRETADGAGLIHQAIPDMAGTEPRPGNGVNFRVLLDAYDWDYHTDTGELYGLTAGDQGYEPTGIVIHTLTPAWKATHPDWHKAHTPDAPVIVAFGSVLVPLSEASVSAGMSAAPSTNSQSAPDVAQREQAQAWQPMETAPKDHGVSRIQ